MRRSIPLTACLVGLAFAAGVSGQSGPSAEAFARDLQKRYDRVSDFSADFTHTYRGGVLRQQATERGRLLIKKPGRMRWEYTSPEQKLFVSDGHKLYSYIPQDRQVMVRSVPQDEGATTPILFLSGKGDLTRDFAVSFDQIAEAPAGTIALRLTPQRSEPEYEWLSLVVDRTSLGLAMLVTVDAQGGRSAFTFSNLKENIGLPDNTFVFRMPRGVDVISDAGR